MKNLKRGDTLTVLGLLQVKQRVARNQVQRVKPPFLGAIAAKSSFMRLQACHGRCVCTSALAGFHRKINCRYRSRGQTALSTEGEFRVAKVNGVLIVFDLDGTLIDSGKDLAVSMNATREQFGMPPLDPKLIYSYVGNGAAVLVRRALGPDAPEPLVNEALAFFLKFYRVHALEHTRLYAGIRETVEELSGAGHRLAVLTNKPVRISTDIIGALGLAQQFIRIYGGDSFASKKPDPVGVLTLMSEANAAREETLVVGDSGVDVRTARNANVRVCGVMWGFQPEAFEIDPPDVLIREPSELSIVIAGTRWA
ncbi:MAG: HAD hydrolase-like protein [Bryobacteraceae bacterium]